MEATLAREQKDLDGIRRARLRRLARLTPGERLERLDSLNRQLSRLREDAERSRAR